MNTRNRTIIACTLLALSLVFSASAAKKPSWQDRLKQGESYWAFQPLKRPPVPNNTPNTAGPQTTAIPANHPSIRRHLQAWYRAQSLSAKNDTPVNEWKDESGHDRHLRATWARPDSNVGAPPQIASRSTIGGKPAVRFGDVTGLASSPSNHVDITGDAAWTMVAVVNIRPPRANAHTSVIGGFGDYAPGHNPGKPWASLLEIRRDGAWLSHSGGYGHDARMEPQSMWALYDRPVVITLVKEPGPMTATTLVFINGQKVDSKKLSGVDTAPDIQRRKDMDIYLGRAHGSLGALRGDIAEFIVYNAALPAAQRQSLEAGLLKTYDIPAFTDKGEPNPIDAFVAEKLQDKKLTSAPTADRRTLIRRAYFDLTGLPPSPAEVKAFLNNKSPGAWERVIGKLLDSRHYGERWGRHWLDVARYADTGGYETDVYYRNAWRYRDYVVKSFNDDKPYDRFVQEQIAGDEIWPNNLDLNGSYVMDPEKKRAFEALTGTGFYALGPQIHESNMDAKKLNNERLTDWVDTTGAAFMGLTFACARCHDHKFDPISQQDYYSLQAVFAGSRETEVFMQHGMGLADWKQHYPKVIALEEAKLAYQHYEKTTRGKRGEAENKRLAELKNAIADRLLQIPAADAQKESYAGIYERPTVTVLAHERPELTPAIHLLNRGDLGSPRQQMSPALPGLLASQTKAKSQLTPGPSGSRKELALWLTRPDHPLTARVMANRIWQWHFGRGIVATPNDFGKMGVPPSHPDLLDWLASEFIARGWSVKGMHRLIMTSQTYRQASDFYSKEHGRIDPDNTLLWRMNRRRLEGEAIWDYVHAVSGTLNRAIGGRPVMPPLKPEELTNKSNWVESRTPSHHTRRGLYIIVRRNFKFPLFDLFDAPVNAVSCSGRNVSTVAPQALWLLNNNLALHQSTHFATRLVGDAGTDSSAQVNRAFELALGRPATETEKKEGVALMKQLENIDPDAPAIHRGSHLAKLSPGHASALTKFCLAIYNLNEFVYID